MDNTRPSSRFRPHSPRLHPRAGDLRLTALSLPVGAAAALMAIAYRHALSRGELLRDRLLSLATSPLGVVSLLLGLGALGCLTGLLTQNEPMIKGSGIPQVEGEFQGHFSPRWYSVLLKKFLGGVLCAIAGLSLGREGPSIQLGAMTGKGIALGLGREKDDRRHLLICGACAGLAAAFNAPFAGALFAVEEIYKRVDRRGLLPAMAAAFTADVISKLFFGGAPTLNFGLQPPLPLSYGGLCLLLGGLTGLLGALYNRTLLFTQRQLGRLPIPLWLRVALPFPVAGALGLLLPEVLGGGHNVFMGLLEGRFLPHMMLLLLVVKFLFSMLSFGSGAPGGIFFPLLVLGALVGGLFAAVPGLPPEYGMSFVVLGMAGMFSSIVRAPLTGVVLVLEMTGSANQLLCLALTAGASTLVAELLKSKPIYDSLLENMLPKQEIVPAPQTVE